MEGLLDDHELDLVTGSGSEGCGGSGTVGLTCSRPTAPIVSLPPAHAAYLASQHHASSTTSRLSTAVSTLPLSMSVPSFAALSTGSGSSNVTSPVGQIPSLPPARTYDLTTSWQALQQQRAQLDNNAVSRSAVSTSSSVNVGASTDSLKENLESAASRRPAVQTLIIDNSSSSHNHQLSVPATKEQANSRTPVKPTLPVKKSLIRTPSGSTLGSSVSSANRGLKQSSSQSALVSPVNRQSIAARGGQPVAVQRSLVVALQQQVEYVSNNGVTKSTPRRSTMMPGAQITPSPKATQSGSATKHRRGASAVVPAHVPASSNDLSAVKRAFQPASKTLRSPPNPTATPVQRPASAAPRVMATRNQALTQELEWNLMQLENEWQAVRERSVARPFTAGPRYQPATVY